MSFAPMLCHAVALVTAIGLVTTATARNIEVVVTGLSSDSGVVGCGLHNDPAGFPGGKAVAEQSVPPKGGQAVCLFEDVTPGRYAVAVLHDVNANGRLDTNPLGIPKEAWGVSGNARPLLRAPRFDEAAFDLGDTPVRVPIEAR
ncbi:DUF2141 domain-containing protein [Paracoccus sp. (in: a-proteobacteria)]|uniref:DUF2141 domain-containing protein n=1 Tax=Paracoccus sp. TaxID=267 RepID=UPI00396C309C